MEENPLGTEGSCEYIEKSSRGQQKRGGPPVWGLGVRPTTLHHKNVSLLQNFSKHLRPGLILWHNLSNGKKT
jgi:hypothetical protein